VKDNTHRFDGMAEAYDLYRPSYPVEAFRALAGDVAGLARCALDVGAGTGLSTRVLADALGPDWSIIAIEPGEDMRRVLTRRLARVPQVQVRAASAEDLASPDGSASLVIACTAFHWFDRDRFFHEAARVLVPGGVMALIRNRRRPTPVVRRFDEFIAGNMSGEERREREQRPTDPTVDELSALAMFNAAGTRVASWTSVTDGPGLIDLYLTRSTIKPVAQRLGLDALKQALVAIVAEEHGAGPFVLEWETTTRWAKRG